MQYHPNVFNSFRETMDTSLVNDIQKAINGEYSAVKCYEQLAQMAPAQMERKQIMEILQDEKRHLKEFSSIYTYLTGKNPVPQITEECLDTYKKGIDVAFIDEQKTVDFYLDIANKSTNMYIKEIFKRAAADEQNHAVWFLYFLTTNKANHQRQNESNYGAKGALNATTLNLPQMLTYAMQDEYLAQARYNNILNKFGYVRTFVQIKEAELRHIYALQTLFERYQVPLPEDISQSFVTTPETIKAAYASGVTGEIDNIAMYNKFLSLDLPSDVRIVFTNLRNASQNHLRAFERGLARETEPK